MMIEIDGYDQKKIKDEEDDLAHRYFSQVEPDADFDDHAFEDFMKRNASQDLLAYWKEYEEIKRQFEAEGIRA